MSWNKPSEAPRTTPKTPTKWRGPVAGILVIVGAAIFAWFVLSPSDSQEVKTSNTKSSLIKEVTPAAAPTNAVAATAKPKVKRIPYWERETTNGLTEVEQLKWQHVRRPKLKPVHIDRPKPRYEIFEHDSENLIAALITAVPGRTSVLGSPHLRGIAEDYAKSCTEPIIVTDKDDEYTAALKRQMIDTKIELNARMAEGEKLETIIQQSWDELRKMDELARQMKVEVKKYAKEHPAVEDFDDFVAAANKMLEDKGSAPLTIGPIFKHNLMNYHKKRGTK